MILTLNCPKCGRVVGDTDRDGLFRIANTVWDSNGTLTVTITETAAGIRASMPATSWSAACADWPAGR